MSNAPKTMLEPGAALQQWTGLRALIDTAIAGLSEEELDLRKREENLSIREIVHHLVESNLIASNIMIAALAKNGTTYDWSWVTPGGSWMKRMGYTTAPIAPALDALGAICEYVSMLIASLPDGSARGVKLLDVPGSSLNPKSVLELLIQEIDHANGHIGDIAEIRAVHKRSR